MTMAAFSRRTSNKISRLFLRNKYGNSMLLLGQARGSHRDFSVKSPGENPLDVLRKNSQHLGLCDANGFRKPGKHWSFAVAVPSVNANEAPNLRTVGFQRVSSAGADFIVKSGPRSDLLTRPVSVLYTIGKYKLGETVEQWRADGHCVKLELSDMLNKVPHHTITEMVSSVRAANEANDATETDRDAVSKDRRLMRNQSHFTEIVQKTRIELENGDISTKELEECLRAWRFIPIRMEQMTGSPDQIMWDRWEWTRAVGDDCPEGTAWNQAQHILPY